MRNSCICVDIDNTINSLNKTLVRKFDINLGIYPDPAIPDSFFNTREGLEMLTKSSPLPYAAQTIQFFTRKGIHTTYLSSRPKTALFATLEWLQFHGFPIDNIQLRLTPAEKAAKIKALQPIAVFEDDPLVVSFLINISPSPTLWLKAWPYNQAHCLSPKVVRFQCWQEPLQKLLREEQGNENITRRN